MNNIIKKIEITRYRKNEYLLNSVIATKVLSDLQNRGYTYRFQLKHECICCTDYNICHNDFEIVEVHSLETASPDEHHVLYAIECDKYNIKGIIINPFENYTSEFLRICIHKILKTEKLKVKFYDKEPDE